MSRNKARARWRRLINEQAVSGLSAAAFCRERKVCRKSFYSWRRRLGPAPEARGEAEEGFAEVVHVPGVCDRTWSGVSIVVGPPLAISVERGFDAATLKIVLSVVEAGTPA